MAIENTYLFNFSLNELNLKPEIILASMGYNNNEISVPDILSDRLNNLMKELPDRLSMQTGIVIFEEQDLVIEKEKIFVKDIMFSTGKIINAQIQDADQIIFFASTLGKIFDEWSCAVKNNGDLLDSYILDTIGSELVELTCDRLETEITQTLRIGTNQISNRYSPGYCNWPLSNQEKLFSLLPPGFCNITLTDSFLMLPIKSVSGVYFAGEHLLKKGYKCSICEEYSCIKRRTP